MPAHSTLIVRVHGYSMATPARKGYSMARSKGDGGLYKDGKGYWTAAVELPPELNGDRRRKVVRRKNKKAALDQLNELKKTVALYGDIPTTGYTVKEWMEYWLETIAPKTSTPGSLRNYQKNSRNFIVPIMGRQKLSKLTVRHVRAFHDRMSILPLGVEMRERPQKEWEDGYQRLSSATLKSVHSTLSRALSDAVTDGHLLANPAKLAGSPTGGEAGKTIEGLSVDQVKRLLAYIATHPMGAMWATYLLTGLRRGEVLGIERDRLDFEKNELDASWQLQSFKKDLVSNVSKDYEIRHVRGSLYLTRPKSKSGWRVIPLVEPLRSVLKLHTENVEAGLIFTRQNGNPLPPDTVGSDWHKLLKGAGVEAGSTLHGARHTLVDLLYDAGIPEQVIQQIVGHSTASMTRSYKTRGNPEQARAALETLTDFIHK